MNKEPLFSIITISYNKGNEIERTIKSIVNQSFRDYEYILVDGKSLDETMNIVKRYEKDFTVIVSEKDNGIYDAMNKGLKLAHGKYVVYINAGDELENNDTLLEVSKSLSDEDFIYGNAKIVYEDKYLLNRTLLNRNTLRSGKMPCHQSIYIKRNILLRVNGFNTKYKIAGDFELCCKLVVQNFKGKYIDSCLAKFYKGGASTNFQKDYAEILDIISTYFTKQDAQRFSFQKVKLDSTRRNILKFLKLDKLVKRIYVLLKGGQNANT